MAQVEAFLQVAIVGNEYTSLALDGLSDECGNLLAIFVERVFERLGIIVGDADETGGQGTVVGIAVRIIAHGDDSDGAAVEVALAADDFHLVIVDTFLDNTPATGELQGGLNALGTGVHGQHFVITEVGVHELLILAEGLVVECTRGQTQLVGLVLQGLDDAGMAVALVNGAVGRQEVEVLLALNVPHVDTFTLLQHDGQGMVVVGAIALFHCDVTLGLCAQRIGLAHVLLSCFSCWFLHWLS